jgi:hypothetical protein
MKSRLVKLTVFLILFLPQTGFPQGVLLSAGESYEFQFSSLSYLQPIAFPNQVSHTGSGDVVVSFTPYSIGDGDSFLLEAFPDSLSDVPVSRVFSFPDNQLPDGVYIGFIWWPGPEPFWPDLQGAARITMLTGNAEITSFGVRQIVGGSVYQQSFPVPEPTVPSFVLFGTLALILFHHRCANRTWHQTITRELLTRARPR